MMRAHGSGVRRNACLPFALLATLAIAPCRPASAGDAAPSAWCDALLPVAAIREAVPGDTTGLVRSATGVVREDTRHCNRRYQIGSVPASDELILLVSPARDAASARAAIERMARDAGGDRHFGLSRPAGIGAAAVHFRRRDLLSNRRMGFHVNFAAGDLIVELGYYSVDDGERNKFVQTSGEVVDIARGVAARMPR